MKENNFSEKTGYPSIDRNHEDFYRDAISINGVPKTTLYDYILSSNKNRLNLPAINYFDHRISYNEFLEKSDVVARALDSFDVKKGDFVTIIAPSLPEAFYTLLGVSKLGAVANLVDPRYGEKAILHKIKESNSGVVIAFDGAIKTFNRKTKVSKKQHILDKVGNVLGETSVRAVIGLPASNSVTLRSILKNDTIRRALFDRQKSEFKDYYTWKEFYKSGLHNHGVVYPKHEKDIPVAVVSTGGSTGTPKGVLLSNENVISATMQCKATGIFPEEARWYDIMPISIAYGMADGSILPFSLGNEVRINPDPTAMSFKTPGQLQMVEDFVRFDPHTIACAPNHVFAIVNSKDFKNKSHSLVNFVVGGDSLNKEQVKRADAELAKMKRPAGFDKERFYGDLEDKVVINTGYGSSEGTGANSVAPGNSLVKEGTVGLILHDEVLTTFKYDEETGEYTELKYVPNDQIDSVTDDQIGEICVQGPNVMLGYLNNEEETNNTLRRHQDGEIWLHQGDQGFIDEDGYVHFVDREKYISVRHDGFKVAPKEIEEVILKDDRIDACKAVIFSDPEEDRGEVIKVYYTLRDNVLENEVHDIEEHANLMCELELADYKCPVGYECLDKLPITNSGKIDVMTLRADAEAKSSKGGRAKVLKR